MGFLKKIFSFGFGKKKTEEEPAVEDAVVEAPKKEKPKAKPKSKSKPKSKPVKKAKPAAKAAPKEEPAEKPKAAKVPAKKDQKPPAKKSEKAKPAPKTKPEPKPKAKVEAKPKPKAKPAKKVKAEPVKKIEEEFEASEDIQPDLDPEILEIVSDDFDEGAIIAAPPEELEIEDSVVTLTERKVKIEAEPVVEEEPQEEKKVGWLKRLTKGLSRSSAQLKENIAQVFTDKKLDEDTLQDLEDILIQADLGVETAMNITDALSAQKYGKSVTDEEVREVMAEEIEKILTPVAKDLDLDLDHQPHVMLIVGVNGSGKTTTIGKLSSKLYDAGFSTTLVAGDTFRAAAIEQLKIWGDRTQSPVLSRPLGSDAAGLAFDAWAEAKEERRDVLLIDTAGRLQNRTELMDELEKIVRVLRKQDPSAPHTVLLTLDATTGQNALNQVEIFKNVAGVNGLVMTKLDGTARGGILVSISAKHNLPIYFVGVGEQVEDLEPFEARDFARSIAGLPRDE